MALARVKRLWIAGPEGTFGTIHPTAGEFYCVPARDIAIGGPMTEPIDRGLQRNTLTQVPLALGREGGTLAFKTHIRGLTTAAGSAVAAIMDTWESKLWKACGYTETLGTGTAIANPATGVTTTNLPVTQTSGCAVGTAIGWVNGSSQMEVAFVTARSTESGAGNLTISPALSGAPSADAVIFSSASYKHPTSGDALSGYSFVVEGDGYEYSLAGANGTVKVENGAAGKDPMLAWSFQFDNWAASAVVPSGKNVGESVEGQMPTWAPILAHGGRFVWNATARALAECSFDPGLKLSERSASSGAHGRSGWVITDRKTVMGIKLYQIAGVGSGASLMGEEYAARSERACISQWGRTEAGTGIAAIMGHKCQIAEYPHEGDIADGQLGHDMKIQINSSETTSCPDWAIAFL